jgi:hypothetical protein
LWQKIVIVSSAVPIALVVNVLRITATGVLFETVGSEWAKAVFHDLAGWLMMPAALVLLGLELKLLSHLLVEPGRPGPRGRDSGRQFSMPLPGRSRPGPRRKWQPAGTGANPAGPK